MLLCYTAEEMIKLYGYGIYTVVFCVQVLKDLTSLVSSVAFSPNGWYLAATDTNGILAVWSTKATIAKIKLNSEQCLNRILMFAVVDPFEVASMQCHDSRQQ